MQIMKGFAEIPRIGIAARHDVIVIGKHGPRFELPTASFGQGEQMSFQKIALLRRIKEMLFVQGAGGDKIDRVVRQTMRRRVWPVLGWQLEF